MDVSEKIANIVSDKKEKLNGFKVLGVFPFYLKYIRFNTHINLLVLKEKIQKIKGDSDITLNDFYNHKLLKEVKPLIDSYCTMALINDRFFGFLLTPFIKRKVRQCSQREVHGLYSKIVELSDPAFFLDYWTHLMKRDYTVLKTGNPSSEQLEPIKKSSEVQKKK